jgi:type IV pilus assembly protein PilV
MKRQRINTSKRARRGFTLVELIIAIVILVVGVLGLASTAAVVMKQITASSMQTRAAMMADSRLEQLRSVPCAQMAAGTATVNGVTETWRVTVNARTATLVDVVTWAERRVTRSVTFTSERPCVA